MLGELLLLAHIWILTKMYTDVLIPPSHLVYFLQHRFTNMNSLDARVLLDVKSLASVYYCRCGDT